MEIRKVKLYINGDEKSKKIETKLKELLIKNDFAIDDDCDLAVAIGGDGTFIKMVHDLDFNDEIYYVGINAGTLGFLQEINVGELDNFVNCLKNGNYILEDFSCQETNVTTLENTYHFYSLNEIVIRDYKFRTAYLVVRINNELLEEFAGDGLLISTTIGSTAYNASLGGAMVLSEMHAIQLTPIAPLVNRAYKSLCNSLIMPEDTVIRIDPGFNRANDLLVIVDGMSDEYMDVLQVETWVSKKRLKRIKLNNSNLTKTIREKFLN